MAEGNGQDALLTSPHPLSFLDPKPNNVHKLAVPAVKVEFCHPEIHDWTSSPLSEHPPPRGTKGVRAMSEKVRFFHSIYCWLSKKYHINIFSFDTSALYSTKIFDMKEYMGTLSWETIHILSNIRTFLLCFFSLICFVASCLKETEVFPRS